MNTKINKKKLGWLIPSIAIIAVITFVVVQYTMADVALDHDHALTTRQIDPMDMMREIWAIEVGTDCGMQCEDCIEDFAMMQELFQEQHLPHHAYIADFDYLVAALTAYLPAFYDAMPYANAARGELESFTHINNVIFLTFLWREFGIGFMQDLGLPALPLHIPQTEVMYGDFTDFLAKNRIDANFFVLPNSNTAVFLPDTP